MKSFKIILLLSGLILIGCAKPPEGVEAVEDPPNYRNIFQAGRKFQQASVITCIEANPDNIELCLGSLESDERGSIQYP